MKCTCGQEFEGKFCPNCGRKAENNTSLNDAETQFESDNNETQVDSEEETEESGFVNGWNKLLGGIIMTPQMKAKFPKHKILLTIVFWLIVFVALLLAKDVIGEN